MFQGKVKAALWLLPEQNKGTVLRINEPVGTGTDRTGRDVLIDKHPAGQTAQLDAITDNESPDIHPVLFESLYAARIRSAALHASGAAGPTGLDALGWRQLCTSFKPASQSYAMQFALSSKVKKLRVTR